MKHVREYCVYFIGERSVEEDVYIWTIGTEATVVDEAGQYKSGDDIRKGKEGYVNFIFATEDRAIPHTAVIDLTNPEITSATVSKDANGNLVLTVVANDENLYSLEIDHSHGEHGNWSEANLPEFHVYADADKVYGKSEADFLAAGLTVNYNATTLTWTLIFKHDGQAMEVINNAEISKGAIDFFLVAHDEAGNSSGSMHDRTYTTVSHPAKK